MEPEAHVNTVLATESQQPQQFGDPELTEALHKMALSDTSSWEEVDRYTEQSSGTGEWSKVGNRDAPHSRGTGASGPATKGGGSDRSRSPSGKTHTQAPERQGYRGGAGLGRGVPTRHFQTAKEVHVLKETVSLQTVCNTEKYQVQALPESFPYLDEEAKRLSQHLTDSHWQDSIVIRPILKTYTVQKSRQTVNNILKQPHRQQGERAGIGAKPMREMESVEEKPDRVCGDCGAAWKDNARKCWACGGKHPMMQEEYETRRGTPR